jgi:hypothetical protein
MQKESSDRRTTTLEKLGVEPSTSCRNMSNAKHALYQMSYIPLSQEKLL